MCIWSASRCTTGWVEGRARRRGRRSRKPGYRSRSGTSSSSVSRRKRSSAAGRRAPERTVQPEVGDVPQERHRPGVADGGADAGRCSWRSLATGSARSRSWTASLWQARTRSSWARRWGSDGCFDRLTRNGTPRSAAAGVPSPSGPQGRHPPPLVGRGDQKARGRSGGDTSVARGGCGADRGGGGHRAPGVGGEGAGRELAGRGAGASLASRYGTAGWLRYE